MHSINPYLLRTVTLFLLFCLASTLLISDSEHLQARHITKTRQRIYLDRQSQRKILALRVVQSAIKAGYSGTLGEIARLANGGDSFRINAAMIEQGEAKTKVSDMGKAHNQLRLVNKELANWSEPLGKVKGEEYVFTYAMDKSPVKAITKTQRAWEDKQHKIMCKDDPLKCNGLHGWKGQRTPWIE